MPMTPPSAASTTASIRNCSSTSRSSAPIASRMPISRVRSVTLTSMMFMMPMPPTSRLTAATAPSSVVMIRGRARQRVGDLLGVEHGEVVVVGRRAACVARAAAAVRPALQALGVAAVLHRHQQRADPLVAGDAALHACAAAARPRRPGRCPSRPGPWAEHADHLARELLDAQLLAEAARRRTARGAPSRRSGTPRRPPAARRRSNTRPLAMRQLLVDEVVVGGAGDAGVPVAAVGRPRSRWRAPRAPPRAMPPICAWPSPRHRPP